MLVRRPSPSFVCSRCISRQQRRTYAESLAPPAPPSSGAAKLTNRRLISIHGQEAPKFLHGLITSNVAEDAREPIFAAFLNAKGRLLHDCFVYPTTGSSWNKEHYPGREDTPGFLIEFDADMANILMGHLKRHKLRTKLSLRLLDKGELNVWSVWGENGEDCTAIAGPTQPSDGQGSSLGLVDKRAPGMGHRLLLRDGEVAQALEGVEETQLSSYMIRRYLRGVAEGQTEMRYDTVLPMHANIDLMGGIDFKKGCYIGQELTIRTHHQGIVRRRNIPVAIYDSRNAAPPDALRYDPTTSINPDPFADVPIKAYPPIAGVNRRASAGQFIAGIGNIGIACCQLAQMTDLNVGSWREDGQKDRTAFDPQQKFVIHTHASGGAGPELLVKAFVPEWFRKRLPPPKVQRRVE